MSGKVSRKRVGHPGSPAEDTCFSREVINTRKPRPTGKGVRILSTFKWKSASGTYGNAKGKERLNPRPKGEREKQLLHEPLTTIQDRDHKKGRILILGEGK